MIPADVAVASEGSSVSGRRMRRRGLLSEFAGDFLSAAAATLAVALMVAGVFVASRRLAGGMTSGLSAGGMAAAVVAMLAGVVACELLSRTQRGVGRAAARLLPRLGLLLCVWGVCGGVQPAAMGVAVAGMAAAVVSLVPRQALASLRQTGLWSSLRSAGPPSNVRRQALTTTMPLEDHPHDREGFVQQQVRLQTTAGGESIRGTVLVSFRTGDRLAVAHVGFCPPLHETPAVQLSTAEDEPDAVVSPGEILPWGIRVECRLEEAAEEPFDIPVDFVATSTRLCP
ncbi:MAG: hypothetical protein O3A60_00525 [Planctomycetota bacterium]|nr:hypothetical protein [Planctomycetota bacterium]